MRASKAKLMVGYVLQPGPSRYTATMRKESKLGTAMKLSLVECARRLKPEERLAACVNLAKVGAEIQAAGRSRRTRSRKH